MTFQEIFKKVKEYFINTDVSRVKGHMAFQFNIIGEGSGIFYAEIKDGRLYIEPYDYNDRDVTFTATADTYFKIASRQLNPRIAYADRKLKIDGDLGKAMELLLLL